MRRLPVAKFLGNCHSELTFGNGEMPTPALGQEQSLDRKAKLAVLQCFAKLLSLLFRVQIPKSPWSQANLATAKA